MSCKEICIKYKAKKPLGGHYGAGNKRCQICEIFLNVDGLFCPCCGYRLRTKPRSKLFKAKLRAKIKKESNL